MRENTPDENTLPGRHVRASLGLMTPDELASALNHENVVTLASWRSKKTGPSYTKLGKSVFYRVEDVLRWIGCRVVVVDVPEVPVPDMYAHVQEIGSF